MTWIQTIVSLFAVVTVILLSYYVSRWIGTRAAGTAHVKYMRVMERLILDKDKALLLVQVGKNVFLIGMCGQAIRRIAHINYEDLQQQPAADTQMSSTVFGELFNRMKLKRNLK